MKVGVAGCGKMGTAIATRLLATGCSVAVWNRSRPAIQHLTDRGAKGVQLPEDLWEHCDFVISSLGNEQALRDVYLGANGLLEGRCGGKLALDASTVPPAVVQEIGQAADGAGCAFLDCPVLGTTAPARDGKLIAMVGGATEHYVRAKPLIERLARKVCHLGPIGTGAAMKLAVNIPMVAYWAAISESMALAAQFGLSAEALIDIIGDSPAALAQLPLKRGVVLGENDVVGFTIDGAVGLLGIMRAAGSPLILPVIDAAHASYSTAVEIGAGKTDVAALCRQHPQLYKAQTGGCTAK